MDILEKKLLEDTEEALRRNRLLFAAEKELNERLSKRDFSKVTRVEVIDSTWRAYVNMATHTIELSVQDEGRTLKLFLK